MGNIKNLITISIGEISLNILIKDEKLLNGILNNYSNFRVENVNPTINLQIENLDENDIPYLETPDVKLDNDKIKIYWNSFYGEFDLHNMEGKLKCKNYLDLNNYLRIIYSIILLNEPGFLVHAASLIKNDEGFLFPGKSGAGKTTITRLSRDSIILSDEVSLIKKVDGEYHVFGTPFWGELAVAGENTHAPLKHIFLPKKDKKNYILPVKSIKTLEHLIPNILFFLDDDKLKLQLFNTCYEFVHAIQANELHFLPETSFWSVINAK